MFFWVELYSLVPHESEVSHSSSLVKDRMPSANSTILNFHGNDNGTNVIRNPKSKNRKNGKYYLLVLILLARVIMIIWW